MATLIAIVVGLITAFGGGAGLTALIRARAENGKLRAEARLTNSHAENVMTESIQTRYDHLFDDLQLEVSRLRASELECRATLEHTIHSMAELRLVAVNAQAAVTLLQDRLDRLEDDDIPRHQNAVREVMKQLGITNPEHQ